MIANDESHDQHRIDCYYHRYYVYKYEYIHLTIVCYQKLCHIQYDHI